MIRYLVIKYPRPGVVEDLRIEVVDIERETAERYEGGIGAALSYFAYSTYYWIAFPTWKEAEKYRDPFAHLYLVSIMEAHQRNLDQLEKTLEQGKND
ncbi:hypothetical protein [Pantoea phage Nafs113]|nr:hypothetical protein [Pantoea phage Nafs113]